jgi:hypothetical protein
MYVIRSHHSHNTQHGAQPDTRQHTAQEWSKLQGTRAEHSSAGVLHNVVNQSSAEAAAVASNPSSASSENQSLISTEQHKMTEVAADPQTPQDSLRELNRLLESALRMGGDDTKNNNSGNGNGSSDAKNEESEEPQGGEWRLDTARRLGGVSTNIHCSSNYLFS